MRLIQLEITAFGPYKNKEVIDFQSLNDARLFVISGNTGAGKTALFDAISFALFGQASGSGRRDIQGLRCLLAEPNTHTEVALTFSIRDKRYRARRRVALVKPGNKSATGEENILEQWVPSADRWELMLERNRVREMNETVQRLLGLDQKQFTQIVMLPQGEFEKLLLSDSDEKGLILRHIFDTGLYERFTRKLEQQTKDAAELYRQGVENLKFKENQLFKLFESTIDDGVQEIPWSLQAVSERDNYNTRQVMEALEMDFDRLETYIQQNESELKNSQKEADDATEALRQAETTNKRFELLEDKQVLLADLDKQQDEMEKLEQSVKLGRRAERIESEYDHLQSQLIDAEKKHEMVQEAFGALRKAKQKHQQAQEDYDKEKGFDAKRKELQRSVTTFEGYVSRVKKLEEEHEQAKNISEEIQKDKRKIDHITEVLLEKQDTIINLKEKRDRLQETLELDEDIPQQMVSLKEKQKHLKNAADLQEKEKDYSEKVQTAEADRKQEEDAYRLLEQQWVEGQAAELALKLEEGSPCPVCGSTHHPQPAGEDAPAISKTLMDKVWKLVVDKQSNYQKVLAQWQATQEQLDNEWQWLADYQVTSENLDEACQENQQLISALEKKDEQRKQQKTDLKDTLTDLKNNEKEQDTQKTDLEDLKTGLGQKENKKAVLTGSIMTAAEQIPAELQTTAALDSHLEKERKELDTYRKNWEKAQQDLNTFQNQLTEAQKDYENGKKNHRTAKEKVAEQLKRWQEKLQKESFSSEQAFLVARIPPEKMGQEEDRINEYKEVRNELRTTVKDLQQELEGLVKQDLELMAAKRDSLMEQLEKQLSQVADLKSQHRQAKEFQRDILSEETALFKKENERNRLTFLYRTANGSDNQERISLETYVQQTYFRQILQAANQRLRTLADGRIELVHREEREKYGKRSGLGIEVLDMYSGGNRSVHTLSGGEKFNASLCLALGLYDIIQRESGGTVMETMFIDEGFGSLDTHESLPRAVDLLMEIQTAGRVIGVISHVEELKERLPAVLSVRKLPDGSSSTSVWVK